MWDRVFNWSWGNRFALDQDWNAFVRRWLGISLLLHIAAAILSTGYQNSDEHFQILEFLSAWLGRSSSADLPVEFHRMMRSWMQPFFYAIPTEVLRGLGIENPFSWALSYRLVSALIGWLSVVGLALCVPLWTASRELRRAGVLGLTLMWFIPALHARHSSENLGGAVFFMALSGWVLTAARMPERRNGELLAYVPWGLLFGLSFHIRYQIAVMIAGFALWLLVFSRPTARAAAGAIIGLALGLTAGVVADRLGYGRWTVSAWNYFQFNIAEGRLTAAGTSPWWDYFRRIWTESVPGLAFLNLLALLLFWIRRPAHPLTWAMAPFFIFHLFTAHKETRFLFPLAHAAPLACILLWNSTGWLRGGRRAAVASLVVLNCAVLLVLTCTPVWFPGRFYAEVYRRSETGLQVLYYADDHPFVQLGIPMNFYRPPGLKVIPLTEATSSADPIWVAAPRADWVAERWNCRGVFAAYPLSWIQTLSRMGLERLRQLRNWTLYMCDRNPEGGGAG